MLHSLAHLLANLLPGSNLQMNLWAFLLLIQCHSASNMMFSQPYFYNFQLSATTTNLYLFWKILYTNSSTSTHRTVLTIITVLIINVSAVSGELIQPKCFFCLWTGVRLFVAFGKYHLSLRTCWGFPPSFPIWTLLPPGPIAQRNAAHHRIQPCCCPLTSDTTWEMHPGCRRWEGHLHLGVGSSCCSQRQ